MPESILPQLARSSLAQAATYFSVVLVLYLVVWRWGRGRFRSARIPTPDRVDARQIRREVGNTFVTLLAGTASAGTVLGLYEAGLTRLSDAPVSPVRCGAWLCLGLLFNDAWF